MIQGKNKQFYPIFRRGLKIVKIIKEESGVNRKVLSDRLGVSKRTVTRYLEVLRDVGYPIEFNRKTGQYEMVHVNYTELGEDLELKGGKDG